MAVDPERMPAHEQEEEARPPLDLSLAEVRDLHLQLVNKETRRANLDGIRFVLGHEIQIDRIDKTKLNTGLIFKIAQKKYKEAERGQDF